MRININPWDKISITSDCPKCKQSFTRDVNLISARTAGLELCNDCGLDKHKG